MFNVINGNLKWEKLAATFSVTPEYAKEYNDKVRYVMQLKQARAARYEEQGQVDTHVPFTPTFDLLAEEPGSRSCQCSTRVYRANSHSIKHDNADGQIAKEEKQKASKQGKGRDKAAEAKAKAEAVVEDDDK